MEMRILKKLQCFDVSKYMLFSFIHSFLWLSLACSVSHFLQSSLKVHQMKIIIIAKGKQTGNIWKLIFTNASNLFKRTVILKSVLMLDFPQLLCLLLNFSERILFSPLFLPSNLEFFSCDKDKSVLKHIYEHGKNYTFCWIFL